MEEQASTSTRALVPTAHASRYLQQLCKHWSHNLEVHVTRDEGTIRFPAEGRAGNFPDDALVTLTAQQQALSVYIAASTPDQRDIMKGVLAKHLDRFAFREAPLPFNWRDEAPSA